MSKKNKDKKRKSSDEAQLKVVESQSEDEEQEEVDDLSAEALLAWDGDLQQVETITLRKRDNRPAIDIVTRSLAPREFRQIEEQASDYERVGGKNVKVADDDKSSKLMIFKGVNSPDLSSKPLQQKFNKGPNPEDIIEYIFDQGDQALIMLSVNKLSGMTDDVITETRRLENLGK